MEFNKQDVIERMQDSDYVKAHREHSKLVEKIDTFLSDNEKYIADFIEGQMRYVKSRMNSTSALFQLEALQLEKTEKRREKILTQLKFLLEKTQEQKIFMKTIKEEYQERFSFDEWESRLIDLQQKTDSISWKDIPLPRQGRKKNPRGKKSTPIRGTVSLPNKGLLAPGGFR